MTAERSAGGTSIGTETSASATSISAVLPGRDLTALFDPASVAVVGASDDESKYGNWIGAQALRMAADRTVYLVNRRVATVLGRPAYPSLAHVPRPAEMVVIAVPAAGFEAAVDEALAAGARAIVGITAGFAELGPEGRAVQDRVARRVRAAGAVMLGPNCLGVADSTTGLTLASNPLPAGPVTLLSQSGNMALELSRFLVARGLGLARFASLGNQADLGVADLVRACAAHAGTGLVAVYCEDFRDGREFVAAAAEATAGGTPVLLLTVGASAAAARGARSHTGALTSDGAVIDAACRAAGVYRVTSPRELADLAAALRGPRFGPGPSDGDARARARWVAVVADGGGHGAVASDLAEAAGLAVPEFSPALMAALAGELPPSAGVRNPVDLAGAGERDISSFGRVLAAVLGDGGVDAALVTGYFGGYREYGPALAAAEVAEAHTLATHVRVHGKPVAVHTMHPESPAARVLTEHGVPVFRAVEDALRTLALLGTGGTGYTGAHPAAAPAPATPVRGDGYAEARALLAEAGVPFPAATIVRTEPEAAGAAKRIGYPVALKALGPAHKSDLGGVALGLRTEDELRAAFRDMHDRLDVPGYSVEAMADTAGGVELIAGVRTDPRFGRVAMVGLGGVFTEVLRDVAFALAPVPAETAKDLLTSLTGAALLRGARGRPPVDLDAVARTVAVITEVAAAHPEIAELEVNPLLATPRGALGLDAHIVLA